MVHAIKCTFTEAFKLVHIRSVKGFNLFTKYLTVKMSNRSTVSSTNTQFAASACGHKSFFDRASSSAESCNRCRQHLAKLSSIEEDLSKYEELDQMLRDYELITILELQDFENFAQNISFGTTSPES